MPSWLRCGFFFLCPSSSPASPASLPHQVGRENFPDGVLYASRETHYSVFKAARMYRMDAEKVGWRF